MELDQETELRIAAGGCGVLADERKVRIRTTHLCAHALARRNIRGTARMPFIDRDLASLIGSRGPMAGGAGGLQSRISAEVVIAFDTEA